MVQIGEGEKRLAFENCSRGLSVNAKGLVERESRDRQMGGRKRGKT